MRTNQAVDHFIIWTDADALKYNQEIYKRTQLLKIYYFQEQKGESLINPEKKDQNENHLAQASLQNKGITVYYKVHFQMREHLYNLGLLHLFTGIFINMPSVGCGRVLIVHVRFSQLLLVGNVKTAKRLYGFKTVL